MNAEKTAEDQRLQVLAKHAWKPGQSGNPAGRPKGVRHKFGEHFLEAMVADFSQHGAVAIQKVRETDPSTYLRVAASILPKELTIHEGESAFERVIEQLTYSQLDDVIAALGLIGASGKVIEGKAEARPTSEPDPVH